MLLAALTFRPRRGLLLHTLRRFLPRLSHHLRTFHLLWCASLRTFFTSHSLPRRWPFVFNPRLRALDLRPWHFNPRLFFRAASYSLTLCLLSLPLNLLSLLLRLSLGLSLLAFLFPLLLL